ncbi:MAG: ATP-binding protein [Gammaproteobacteria bacterium]
MNDTLTTAARLPWGSSLINLRRILILRSLVILGWVVAVGVAHFLLRLEIPLPALLAVIALWLVFNGHGWHRLGQRREVTEREFLFQILLDVVMLAALLFLTGGATNPFTLLLLLPLTVAAAVLPARYSWLVAAITVLCYSLLLLFYTPFHLTSGVAQDGFGIHVVGMWVGFVLSALLIAAFVVNMGATLRERDRVLAAAREQALRDERVVALGALAAGAAHELATPLGTIAMLARELEEECGSDAEARERLLMLQSQVARCKQTLVGLSASAGQSQAEAGYRLALDRYLEQVVEQWQAMRPTAQVNHHWGGPQPAPLIVAEQTLTQALISILNNAADASPQAVEVSAAWDAQRLSLDVCDRGGGMAPAVTAAAGRVPFTTKSEGDGLGLGLYLAYGVISRLGGEVRLYNRRGGGACVHLELPLARLLVQGV